MSRLSLEFGTVTSCSVDTIVLVLEDCETPDLPSLVLGCMPRMQETSGAYCFLGWQGRDATSSGACLQRLQNLMGVQL